MRLNEFAVAYALLGFMGSSAFAIKFWLLDEQDVTPAAFEMILTLSKMPWMLKYIWAWIYERSSCDFHTTVTRMLLVNAVCWVLMMVVSNIGEGVLLLLLTCNSLTMCVVDVVIDGRMVAHSKKAEGKDLPASVAMYRRGGGILGGLSQLLLVRRSNEITNAPFTPQQYFGLLGMAPLIVAFTFKILREKETCTAFVMKEAERRKTFSAVRETIMRYWWVFVCTASLSLVPNDSDAMLLFETADVERGGLGLSTRFIVFSNMCTAFVCIATIVIVRRCLLRVSLHVVLACCILLATMCSLTDTLLLLHVDTLIGVRSWIIVLVTGAFDGAVWDICGLVLMIATASIAPPHHETTFYALVTSLQNGCGILSGLLESVLLYVFNVERFTDGNLDPSNIWKATLACSCVYFLPLLVVLVAGGAATAENETPKLRRLRPSFA